MPQESLIPKEENPNFDHRYAMEKLDQINMASSTDGPNGDWEDRWEKENKAIKYADDVSLQVKHVTDGT